ncbi:MAG: SMC-Scp complex subunit ScpB [Thermoplasmata archaeon]|nr:SMC-Scp complex subunit ScpB [Thermoplasmata archaeon]
MPSRVDDLVLRVEAILFASGKPLSVRELTEVLGTTDFRPVQAAVKRLAKTYVARQTALEVQRVGDRYALQLRHQYLPSAHSVTPVDLPPRTLKTLTLIAYHQPMLQSLLARMVGEPAYEEVQRLRGLGLVHADPKGATLELKTTKLFAEYFGISASRPEEIRRFLEQKLGVSPPSLAPAAPESTVLPESASQADPEDSAPEPESAPAPVAPPAA